MKDKKPPGKLNEPQRNSVEITLRTLEQLVERSRQLRDLASRGESAGILLHLQAKLSAGQLSELEALEQLATTRLRALRDALDLERKTEDPRRKLYSAFSLLWSDLEDIKPRKLERYGVLNPEAAEILGAGIQELVQLSQAFAATLEKEGAD